MEIKAFNPSPIQSHQLSEGTIFTAIQNFIKTSNFPKKLVLKKIELLLEKRQLRCKKLATILVKSRKANEDLRSGISALAARNRKELQDLIQSLT